MILKTFLTIGDAQNHVRMIIDKDFRGFSLNSANRLKISN